MPLHEPGLRVADSEIEYDDELTYRWNGELFTGIGFAEDADGAKSEVSYRYGVQDGPARDWYSSGVLKGETWFRENVQHGPVQEFDQGGKLLIEESFEYGIKVWRSELSKDGELVETFRIGPGSSNFGRLERYRREKGWPS
jgi:antitoxin component YwqK of YwqJK toxin-antitoxin module